MIYGTGEDDAECKFQAGDRKLWLYVGKRNPVTRPEEIKTYLVKNFENYEFEVEKLESKGRFGAFKVSADIELTSELYKPSNWPKKVLVKRFEFKKQNFFRGDTTSSFQ